jgi:regulator of replication initiation timing
MNEEYKEIIDNCNNFLNKSSARYSNTILRAIDDMRRYSGDFWTDEYKKTYQRSKRVNLSLNNWNPMVNAISSPISNSPWHIELTNDNMSDLQEMIDQIENDNDSKSAIVDAFRKSVLTGYGYIIVTTVEDEFTQEAKVVLESASHLDSIAIDPSCNNVDCSDAEEGAVINYLPIKKAKRLFGEDIVPMTYPKTPCAISFPKSNQWHIPQDCVAVISYYTKNDDGSVNFYKIVGNKVVQDINLPIKYIPIIRLSGNEIYEDNNINYNGIIQQTLSLELGTNIAYSSLIERVGRSAKANYMVHQDSLIPESLATCNQDDTAAVIWKGEHQPVPLVESFETGDLQNTISTCRTLMEDTLGIPLTGIVDQRERTATEILRQEVSKESNTANYYNNAYKAIRTIGRIIIEMINGGEDVRFTLENGPSVITRQMKQRQELTALGTIMPDTMKPIIAKYFADTLKNDLGDELSRNIVANLPQDVKFISDNQDPAAIHELNQMKAAMEDTMNELDKMKAENEELKYQLNATQLSLMNNREQRELDFAKFQVTEQDKMNIEMAKLQQNGVKIDNEAMVKQQELAIKEAESSMNRQEQANDAYIQGVTDTLKGDV